MGSPTAANVQNDKEYVVTNGSNGRRGCSLPRKVQLSCLRWQACRKLRRRRRFGRDVRRTVGTSTSSGTRVDRYGHHGCSSRRPASRVSGRHRMGGRISSCSNRLPTMRRVVSAHGYGATTSWPGSDGYPRYDLARRDDEVALSAF